MDARHGRVERVEHVYLDSAGLDMVGVGVAVCVPLTCGEQGMIECGMTTDGCGEVIECGTCPQPGGICAGSGTPGVCICSPMT